MTVSHPVPVRVRWADRKDAKALMRLPRSAAGTRAIGRVLARCVSSTDTAGLVAEVGGRVVGFAAYRMVREVSEIHLVALFVRPKWRRRGIGWALLSRVVNKLEHGYHRVVAVVPEDRLSAQLFLKGSGFLTDGVVPGRFRNRDGYAFFREVPIARADVPDSAPSVPNSADRTEAI